MDNLRNILKSFSELRNAYLDIQTAIEVVCISTGLDQKEVLSALNAAGVFILPNSEEEHEIKRFIGSVDRTKTTANELARKVGFRFCISAEESRRLVEKWLNYSEDILA